LREVHFVIQKRALGKFTRSRRARSGMETGFQDPRGNQPAPVTTNLDDIFAGITRRRAVHRQQHLIDGRLAFDDVAEGLRMRGQLRRSFLPAKDAIGDRDCLRS